MEPLIPEKYYHIYNRGNNGEDLFQVRDNYLYFLRLYDKYIYPVADTFAWVLMKNHFHLLLKIRELKDLPGSPDLPGFENLAGLSASQQFSNLLIPIVNL